MPGANKMHTGPNMIQVYMLQGERPFLLWQHHASLSLSKLQLSGDTVHLGPVSIVSIDQAPPLPEAVPLPSLALHSTGQTIMANSGSYVREIQ